MLMTTAFETIFELPRNNKKEKFGDHIERLTRIPGDRARQFLRHGDNAQSKMSATKKREWAHRFYELRNAIAHGSTIPEKQMRFYGQQHFYVAVLIFIQCVKELLSDLSYKNWDRIVSKRRSCFVHECGYERRDSAYLRSIIEAEDVNN
jgi:hypothetical protein